MDIKKNGILAYLIICSLFGYGQIKLSDTTIIMNEVVIRSSRVQNFAIGSNIQRIDSLALSHYINQSFAELLSIESLVSIKAYGVGGLASPSVRGGGASHTAVIWNGLNIQSPMNGSANMALLPVSMFGAINIQYGGSGTLFGSGAMNGAIHLESDDLFQQDNQLTLGLSLGSFGGKNINAGFKFGNEQLGTSLKFYYNEAQNDFRFKNTAKYQQPYEKQSNADFGQSGLIFENQIKTGEHSYLNTSFWYQKYDKKLQTLMIDSDIGKASQLDKNVYLMLRWRQNGKRFNVSAKSAFIKDIQQFTNPVLAEPVTNNQALSFINQAELKWAPNTYQIIDAGINFTYEEVNSEGYKNLAKRNRISFFISHKLVKLFDRLDIVNSIRKEMVDNGNIPSVFSIEANYNFSNKVIVKGNISKNYNLPSLNDLHWRSETYVSGNPNLASESGWSGEIGFSETIFDSQPHLTLSQNFYYSKIKDWIVWLPGERGVWKPENKNTAKTKGLDLSLNSSYNLSKVLFVLNAKYNWNSSRFRDEDAEYLPVIYTPENTFLLGFDMNINRLNLSYNHKFTSERLYDQNHKLPSYHLASLNINYEIRLNPNTLNLSFKINNIWNENYQVVAWYAMPPVNYLVSVSYRLTNF